MIKSKKEDYCDLLLNQEIMRLLHQLTKFDDHLPKYTKVKDLTINYKIPKLGHFGTDMRIIMKI